MTSVTHESTPEHTVEYIPGDGDTTVEHIPGDTALPTDDPLPTEEESTTEVEDTIEQHPTTAGEEIHTESQVETEESVPSEDTDAPIDDLHKMGGSPAEDEEHVPLKHDDSASDAGSDDTVDTEAILNVDPLYFRLTKFLQCGAGSPDDPKQNVAEILTKINDNLEKMNGLVEKFLTESSKKI